MTGDTEWRRGTITEHYDFGRNGQSAGVFDGTLRYPVKPGFHGSQPPIGTEVFFKMIDGWAVLSDQHHGSSEPFDEAGDPVGLAAQTPAVGCYENEMKGRNSERLGERDQPMGYQRHGSDGSELDAMTEAGMGGIQARPMRIQDVIRDAHPLPWKIQRGGGFRAEPEHENGVWLEVQPYEQGGWWWRAVSSQLTAGGDARGPGEAVAAAEAVYWICFRHVV